MATTPSTPERNRADGSRAAEVYERSQVREELRPERQWVPASAMPEPNPEAGYRLGWVRVSALEHQDVQNVNKSFREGWEPCKRSDHPELRLTTYGGFRNDAPQGDEIIIGGLMLCRMPEQLAKSKDAWNDRRSQEQVQGAEAKYRRDARSDARMPVDGLQIETEVSFGKGGR